MSHYTSEELYDATLDYLRGDRDEPLLLPCPFCGGEGDLVEELPNHGTFVQCLGCYASSSLWVSIKEDATRNAIESWNRRADTSQHVV